MSLDRLVKNYLRENLGQSLLTSPFHAPKSAWLLFFVYGVVALILGFASGLLEWKLLSSPLAFVMPFSLLVFPSLLEEAFFRGVLIPRNILAAGLSKAALAIGASTFAFVFWHPLNAVLFNPTALPLFFDPWFLLMVTILGVTCGVGYVLSKSLWFPVMVHWLTVTIWVLFLGGRNLLLET